MSTEHLAARERMVEQQLRRRGIRDERVLRAMALVPRHCFVPEHMRYSAYEDCSWPIGEGQTISQPYMVAHSCELAALCPQDTVLEVGVGSGYQAAVLAQLCERVVGVELIEPLAERARKTLRDVGIDNVTVVVGDGSLGYPALAPYDAIVVAAAAPDIPAPLVDQLKLGGRLVIPVGAHFEQELTVLTKGVAGLERQCFERCSYVPLRGELGWPAQKVPARS